MKNKKRLAKGLAVMASLAVLTGCTRGHALRLANEITCSLDGVSELTISYDEENVTFYRSERDELTVKEYMTENKSSYYANVTQNRRSIQISEGGKPLFKDGFSRSIEVYLPESYRGDLTVTTTDGDIDISEAALSVNALRIDSTAGTVKLNRVEAQNIHLSSTSGTLNAGFLAAEAIRVDTTSGSFSCESLEGNVTYTTTSGNAAIKAAAGSGSYRANNSGKINIVYNEVTGDLSFFNKNDKIQITLPADLEFEFEATTKNGSISTSFPECISIQGRTASGAVGAHPTVTVKVETKNGTIEVTQ